MARERQTLSNNKYGGLLRSLLGEPSALLLALCLASGPAQAADATYNASAGSETLKNVVGVLYIVLLTFFAGRLFLRRVKRSKSQRVYGRKERSKALELLDKATERANPTSPLSSFAGAAQAGALCFVLYLFTTRLDGTFENAQLPSNFTARNITLTVQTIVRAVSYLFTFIAGVNTVGLLGLTVQLVLYPEKAEDFDKHS
ncbi:hypothetical protein WJX73_003408 [Symbiochloris irregularis]|uniref:Uncharacterized protein n=1 Tax=Symbiochloris irregularis TaxID=706552 RepID=A0AAW1NQF2_9CHLO